LLQRSFIFGLSATKCLGAIFKDTKLFGAGVDKLLTPLDS
jgi:hypothetical protein